MTKSSYEADIKINETIKIEEIFGNKEKLKKLDELVKEIKVLDISKAQFSAFENQLNKVNYNFNSSEITKFIDEREKRKKSPEFYKTFQSQIIAKIGEIEIDFGLGKLDQKHKNRFNRKLVEYLKKYYRYEIVLKGLKENKNSEKGE